MKRAERVASWIGGGLVTFATAAVVVVGWEWRGVLGVILALVAWKLFWYFLAGPALVHWVKRDADTILKTQRHTLKRWGA